MNAVIENVASTRLKMKDATDIEKVFAEARAAVPKFTSQKLEFVLRNELDVDVSYSLDAHTYATLPSNFQYIVVDEMKKNQVEHIISLKVGTSDREIVVNWSGNSTQLFHKAAGPHPIVVSVYTTKAAKQLDSRRDQSDKALIGKVIHIRYHRVITNFTKFPINLTVTKNGKSESLLLPPLDPRGLWPDTEKLGMSFGDNDLYGVGEWVGSLKKGSDEILYSRQGKNPKVTAPFILVFRETKSINNGIAYELHPLIRVKNGFATNIKFKTGKFQAHRVPEERTAGSFSHSARLKLGSAVAPSAEDETATITPVKLMNKEDILSISEFSTKMVSELALSIKLPGFRWSDPIRLTDLSTRKPKSWQLASKDPKTKYTLKILIRRLFPIGTDPKTSLSHHLCVLAEYWIVNLTGLKLQVKNCPYSDATEQDTPEAAEQRQKFIVKYTKMPLESFLGKEEHRNYFTSWAIGQAESVVCLNFYCDVLALQNNQTKSTLIQKYFPLGDDDATYQNLLEIPEELFSRIVAECPTPGGVRDVTWAKLVELIHDYIDDLYRNGFIASLKFGELIGDLLSSNPLKMSLALQDPHELYKQKGMKQQFYNGKTTNILYFGYENLNFSPDGHTWSESFDLTTADNGLVHVIDRYGAQFSFAVSIEAAPAKFRLTKVITIRPAFFLVNNTSDLTLCYKQVNHDKMFTLEPNKTVPYHFPNRADIRIVVKLLQSKTWSEPLTLWECGLFQLPVAGLEKHHYLNFELQSQRSVMFAIFKYPTTEFYKIKNSTDFEMHVRHKPESKPSGVSPTQEKDKAPVGDVVYKTIPPHGELQWVWEKPQGENKLSVRFSVCRTKDPNHKFNWSEAKANTFDFSMNQFMECRVSGVPDKEWFKASVEAEGFTRILILKHELPNSHQYERDIRTRHEAEAPQLALYLSIKEIGVSLTDNKPQELLYFSIEDFTAGCRINDKNSEMRMQIGAIQLDNQLHTTRQDVQTLWWSHRQEDIDTGKRIPFLDVCLNFDTSLGAGNTERAFTERLYSRSVKNFSFAMTKCSISCDETIIYHVFAYVMYLQKSLRLFFGDKIERQKMADLLKGQQLDLLCMSNDVLPATVLLLHQFHVEPSKVNFSYTKTAGRPTDKHLNVTDTQIIYEILKFVRVSVQDFTIELPKITRNHHLTSTEQLYEHIPELYKQALTRQLVVAFGASDVPLAAPPIYVMSHMYSGIRSATRNPSEFSGSKMWSSSVSTAAGAVDRFSRGLSRTLQITLDKDTKKQRKQEHKAKNAKDGFKTGAKVLGHGVFDGLTGIVMDPVKGAQRSGVKGFGIGIGTGVIGVVSKPVVGGLDLVSKTSEGISNSAKIDLDPGSVPPPRKRVPRYFDSSGVLLSYTDTEAKALGQTKLFSLPSSIQDSYIKHWDLRKRSVILSDNRLVAYHNSNPRKHFEIPLSKLSESDIGLRESRVGENLCITIAGKAMSCLDAAQAQTVMKEIQACLREEAQKKQQSHMF